MRARWSRRPHQWVLLLLMLRGGAAATAVALLSVHRVTGHDDVLIVVLVVYAVATGAVVVWRPTLAARPASWALDIAVLFALIALSGDWRSPFYLMALTSLAMPAAALGTRRAVLLGGGYAAAFAVAAHFVGPDPLDLGTQASIETLATHLVLPPMVCLGVGYAAETLRNLVAQRVRAERLAIEAERRRIAWELHDSAKQRVHAAHLVISSLSGTLDAHGTRIVEQALTELQAASAEMDTSLAELQQPLLGKPLAQALSERAVELSVAGGTTITVHGDVDEVEPLPAAHAFRIGLEALTNAVRHAGAAQVRVELGHDDDVAWLVVRDDGLGMPAVPRPGSTGLMAMRNRARSIGGELSIGKPEEGTGTVVELRFPWRKDDSGA